jgi:site-specific DNA recombinase
MRKRNGPAPQSGGKRFVSYARVSTDEQADTGLSLTTQTARLEAWAVATGHRLVASETDTASGAKDAARRPGLSAALRACKSGVADGLVVVRLDRLGRSTTGVLALLANASKQGWEFVSINEAIDTTTPAGVMFATMLAAFSQYERELNSLRTSAVFSARRTKGLAAGSRIPFGYRLQGAESLMVRRSGDDRALVAYPPEMAVLERMVRLREQGTSYPAITAQLNASGSRNPRTQGPWSQGVVYAILQTRARWARDGG